MATLFLAGVAPPPPVGFAAETIDPVMMTKTVIVITVDSEEPLDLRSSSQERPPVITLTFPKRRVVGSLPERSSFAKGVIRTIVARYDGVLRPQAPAKRFLHALQIGLSAPYPHRVRSEPGRVVVEVDHPASVDSASMEVGLRGGTIVGAIGQSVVSQRFRAMQEALAHATPTAWTMAFTAEAPETASGGALARGDRPAIPRDALRPELQPTAVAAPSATIPLPSRPAARRPFLGTALMVLAAASVGAWWFARGRPLRLAASSAASRTEGPRPPSAVVLVDQLIWRAFERRGYQLLHEAELTQPSPGTLRVMVKDGAKAALLFAGQGPFFEKQTVERFIQAMRQVDVGQGVLAAAGSFTVPAQRLAEQHEITLIGREQLTELLSLGAGSEYFARQLEQSHARLEEAKETLRQYASELDTLRRQRNEASWYLGEERAKAAKLEAQLTDAGHQLHRYEAELRQWEQEAAALRRRWEESQWYLGESVARTRHLETQLGALQEIAERAAAAEQERQALRGDLTQERARSEALEAQLASLQLNLEESSKRELALQMILDQLKQEVRVLQTSRDRRGQARLAIPQAFVELLNGQDAPLFAGSPRNVSSTGLGLETEQELPARSSIRIRLSLPGCDPIESKGRIVWQRAEEPSASNAVTSGAVAASDPPQPGPARRYRSGCRLLRVPAATRARLEGAIKESHG